MVAKRELTIGLRPVRAWAWVVWGKLCYWSDPTKSDLVGRRRHNKPSPEAKPVCVTMILNTDYRKLIAERDRYKRAIEWAMGQGDEFAPRPKRSGAYWWRTELWRRAGLTKD